MAGISERTYSTLEDLFFLEMKIGEGKTFEIPGYLDTALSQRNDTRLTFRIPELLKEVLLRNILFISRHAQDYPQAFFQCCWNLVDWTEETGMEELKSLLLLWKEQREKRYPDQYWIRNTIKPVNPLGGALVSRVVTINHPPAETIFSDEVVCFAVSCRGDRLLAVSERGTSRIGCYDLRNTTLVSVLEGENTMDEKKVDPFRRKRVGITSLAFSFDGTYAVSGSRHGAVRLWDLEKMEMISEKEDMPYSLSGTKVCFSPDGRFFLAAAKTIGEIGDPDSKGFFLLKVYEKRTGKEVWKIRRSDDVADFAFSPGSDNIIMLTDAGELITHSLTDSGVREGFEEGSPVFLYRYNPLDDTLLVTDSSGASKKVTLAVQPLQKQPPHKENTHIVTNDALSTDGTLFALGETAYDEDADGYLDSRILIFNTESGRVIETCTGHKAALTGLTFSSDGKRLYSSSQDGTVCTWDLTRRGTASVVRDRKTATLFPASAVPENERNQGHDSINVDIIETDAGEYRFMLTDSRTGEPIRELEHTPYHTSDSYDLDWRLSEDGKRIALFNEEDTSDDQRFGRAVMVWDTGSGTLLDFFPAGTELKAAAEGSGTYPFAAVVDDTEIRVIGSEDREVYGYFPGSIQTTNRGILSDILVPEPGTEDQRQFGKEDRGEIEDARAFRRALLVNYFEQEREEQKRAQEAFESKFDVPSMLHPVKKRKEISLDDL